LKEKPTKLNLFGNNDFRDEDAAKFLGKKNTKRSFKAELYELDSKLLKVWSKVYRKMMLSFQEFGLKLLESLS
jgi:hypothetical protein